MKKTDVYVVVDSPKKAKKLKKVLDMFGEKYGGCTFELLENKEGDKVYFNMGFEWNTDTVSDIHMRRQEVSIKELRNILAKEHLKEGDIIVAGIGSTKYVVNVEKVNSSNRIPIGGNKWICIDGDDYPHEIKEGEGGFRQFIRYATEEERALLEPNKEIRIGKWYKDPSSKYLVYVTEILGKHNYVEVYGFGSNGNWFNKWDTIVHQLCVEATAKEVEQALIEEAKRRYKVGDAVTQLDESNIGNFPYAENGSNFKIRDIDKPLLQIDDEGTFFYLGNLMVFKNGRWAEIVEHAEELIKPRLGRKQERVILNDNDNGHEICTFHEKYKYLAPLVVEFLKGK